MKAIDWLLFTGIAIAALTITALTITALGDQLLSPRPYAVSLPSGAALFETSLQDRISSSDTSMTLVANSLRGSETLAGYQCFTIDEGRSDSEFVCGTVSGTSVTSLERGLSFLTGTTSVTALKFAHRKGANVKVTDYPLIQRMKAVISGQDTLPALLTYVSGVECTAGSASTTLCSKAYSDALVNQGAATSTEAVGGIVRLATALQAASSTDLGASAPLVLQAKNATSTPNGTAASLFTLILNNAGKIAQAAIDLTTTYTWTALHTFSGGLTSSATTTLAGSNYLSNAIVINTVPYQFPSSQCSSGQVLVNNGAGVLSCSNVVVSRYSIATSSPLPTLTANNSTATSSAVLVIPANALNASSTITFKGNFTCDNSGNGDGTCQVYLRTSTGATLATVAVGTDTAASQSYGFDMDVVPNGSASSQTYIGHAVNYAALKGTADVGGNGAGGTASVNLASGVTLYVVVRSGAGSTVLTMVNYAIIVNP